MLQSDNHVLKVRYEEFLAFYRCIGAVQAKNLIIRKLSNYFEASVLPVCSHLVSFCLIAWRKLKGQSYFWKFGILFIATFLFSHEAPYIQRQCAEPDDCQLELALFKTEVTCIEPVYNARRRGFFLFAAVIECQHQTHQVDQDKPIRQKSHQSSKLSLKCVAAFVIDPDWLAIDVFVYNPACET